MKVKHNGEGEAWSWRVVHSFDDSHAATFLTARSLFWVVNRKNLLPIDTDTRGGVLGRPYRTFWVRSSDRSEDAYGFYLRLSSQNRGYVHHQSLNRRHVVKHGPF